MYCTVCGTKILAGANFCPKCGKQLAASPGGVNTSGGPYIGRDVNARGDFIGRDRIDNTYDSSGLGLITKTTGISRLFVTVGLLLAFVGFGLFAYPIVTTVASGFASTGPGSVHPDTSLFAQLLPIGFGLMFVGIVVSNIGLLLFRRK